MAVKLRCHLSKQTKKFMKNPLLQLLLLVALVFNLTSCGDDKESDPKPATKKEILTAKSWKMAKIVYNGQDVSSVDDPMVAAFMNSRVKFNADGTATFTSSGSTDSGIWEFASNETVVVLDPRTPDEERWTLTELKDNSLKVRVTYDDLGDPMLFELEMVYAQ